MRHIEKMIEAEHRRTEWVMPAVLLLVGLPCMLIALYMAGEEAMFRMGAEKVQGVVIDRSGDVPTLTVEYPAAGARHKIESFGSDLYEDVEPGEKVGVFVKAAQPAQGRLDYFTAAWMLPLILGAFGSFFGIPGLFFLRGYLRGAIKSDRLDTHGQPVKAEVVEIRPVLTLVGFSTRHRVEDMECELWKDGDRWRLEVNGEEQDPFAAHANREWGVAYSVIARWQDPRTGKTHTCEGDPVGIDPSFYLQFGTVTVIADPENPDNARVDMSFLPDESAMAGQDLSELRRADE
jgi:hypothetical protein